MDGWFVCMYINTIMTFMIQKEHDSNDLNCPFAKGKDKNEHENM